MGNNLNVGLTIPPYSKIKVYWDEKAENYSRAAKNKITNYFATKYGVSKNNINVQYRRVMVNGNGDTIEVTGAGIENIMDINYQRSLMKEVLKRDEKTVDFNRLIMLDEKVNAELNVDLNAPQQRNWTVKWLMVDNFLSFGENNYLPFSKLKGLTIVNSIPENQGGKTTLTIDAIKFLLHGNTTKTDTNDEIFNTFSGKNDLVVRGMIDIEGDEIIIERKMKRSAKKDGGWNITNRVNYYKLLPDGEEDPLNEEDSKQTTKKIRESVGSEKDFEMLVLATEKNLEDLIGLTTTESGKVLTRLIGLEILELKETAARAMYNEFSKKKKSNSYDVITLGDEIIEDSEKIIESTNLFSHLTKKLAENKTNIGLLSLENDRLLNSKEKIDVTIFELNPSKLDGDIKILIENGITLSEKVKKIKLEIDNFGLIDFDEDKLHGLNKLYNEKFTEKALKEADLNRLNKVITDLISGGICQSCNRKLDDVDNTEHIKSHELEVKKIENNIFIIVTLLNTTKLSIDHLNETKLLIDNKNRLDLDKDRAEVEMGSLRNTITDKKNDLKKYNLNLSAIELNRKIDSEVSKIKTDLIVCEYSKTETITSLERVSRDITLNEANVINKTKLIDTIKKEEEVDKIYKTYIELVGKKGISKLVLRSVLPIINSEMERLLEDVCDFAVEIFIDDKNNVQFLIVKNGVTKKLKSGSGLEKTIASIALRCVLGKISTLPMPNFITFDEVLGKIAQVNLENLKQLFDKIKDMYEIVFFITHNDSVKDWSTTILTVIKENDISKITLK